MEKLRVSSYMIPVKLKQEEDKYMLIHGYTGAIDIVSGELLNDIQSVDEKINWVQPMVEHLLKRGYLTTKTQDEEYSYVKRIARALHKRDEILHKSFTWIVSYNCNFRCPYCFEGRDKKDSAHSFTFTKDMVDRTYRAMEEIEPRKELRNHCITLYGGEPLLKENEEIVSYIVSEGQKRGYVFHAITNGYDLNYFMDLLGKDAINHLQITIDGTKEYHNQTRVHYQDPNSFDKIISNIRQILDADLDVQVDIRVNTDNHNLHDFENLKGFFAEKGFFKYPNFRVYSALVINNDAMTEQEKEQVNITSSQIFLEQQRKEGNISSCNGYHSLYKKLNDAIHNQKAIALTSIYCASQAGGYVFSPLGEIYPCWDVVGNKEFQIGQLHPDSIQWYEVELNKWRSHDISTSSCRHCKFAFLCGGGCQAMKNKQCVYFQEILKSAVNDVYERVQCAQSIIN